MLDMLLRMQTIGNEYRFTRLLAHLKEAFMKHEDKQGSQWSIARRTLSSSQQKQAAAAALQTTSEKGGGDSFDIDGDEAPAPSNKSGGGGGGGGGGSSNGALSPADLTGLLNGADHAVLEVEGVSLAELMLSMIMYECPPLVQKAMQFLVAYHDSESALLRSVSEFQLLSGPAEERVFLQVPIPHAFVRLL